MGILRDRFLFALVLCVEGGIVIILSERFILALVGCVGRGVWGCVWVGDVWVCVCGWVENSDGNIE